MVGGWNLGLGFVSKDILRRYLKAQAARLTMIESTSGAQWPVLPQVANGDVWELPFRIFDETSHD